MMGERVMDATGALSDIKKLVELKANGALSEEEFVSLKSDIFLRLYQKHTSSAFDDRVAPLGRRSLEAEAVVTWEEFINSDFFVNSIATSIISYKYRFTRIIDRKDIRNMSITDPAALKVLMAAMSWNWAAFFGGGFWAAYRGAKYWLPLAIFSCLATIGAHIFAIEWLDKASWGVFVFMRTLWRCVLTC